MLSNVVRIIQKISSTLSFGWCLKLWLFTSTSTPSSPVQRANCYKDANGKNLLFATLGSYVALLGAKVFKFPWWVTLAEDEQRLKLVSAHHPQIHLWYEKCVMMWNSTFGKIIFSLCYSDISNCFVNTVWHITMPWGKSILQKLLFHIITHHHAFYFDSCWYFN